PSDLDVTFSLDGDAAVAGTHTQPATGEALNKGWEFTDPVSATHNLSSSGSVAQASPHVWQIALPSDLAAGEHTAAVTATDRYGKTYTDTLTSTVEHSAGRQSAPKALPLLVRARPPRSHEGPGRASACAHLAGIERHPRDLRHHPGAEHERCGLDRDAHVLGPCPVVGAHLVGARVQVGTDA